MAKRKSRKSPKDVILKGMEDARIAALENVAHEYADIRDRRMELNTDEANLKKRALKLMKKHGKTVYKRAGLEIRVVPGEENLKVRVKAEKSEVSIES